MCTKGGTADVTKGVVVFGMNRQLRSCRSKGSNSGSIGESFGSNLSFAASREARGGEIRRPRDTDVNDGSCFDDSVQNRQTAMTGR